MYVVRVYYRRLSHMWTNETKKKKIYRKIPDEKKSPNLKKQKQTSKDNRSNNSKNEIFQHTAANTDTHTRSHIYIENEEQKNIRKRTLYTYTDIDSMIFCIHTYVYTRFRASTTHISFLCRCVVFLFYIWYSLIKFFSKFAIKIIRRTAIFWWLGNDFVGKFRLHALIGVLLPGFFSKFRNFSLKIW